MQDVEELQHISAIKIPRWVNSSKNSESFQLHGFCDARGAASCLRIVVICENNELHIHLIASKSKVSPKETFANRRLKLCGTQMLLKLLSSVRNGLWHTSIRAEEIIPWYDSNQIAGLLLTPESRRITIYVAKLVPAKAKTTLIQR